VATSADLLAALAVALGAVVQAITGVGFGLVCSPFLVAVFGAGEGVRVANLLAILVNAGVLSREHRRVDLRGALLLLVPAVVATPLFALVVRRIDPEVASVVAGVATLLAAGLLAAGLRARRLRGVGGAVAAGVTSAAMNIVSGIGAPTVAMFAQNAGWSMTKTRATLQVYFLCLNVVTLASLGLPRLPIVLVVALAAGFAVGALLVRRVPEAVASRAMLVLAVLGGLAAIVQGLR
jgi:uncharacterized membrane protein YfcA